MTRVKSLLARKLTFNDLQIAQETIRQLFKNNNSNLKTATNKKSETNILLENLPKSENFMEKIQYIIGYGILRPSLR